jgi:hypothetical protein
VRRLALLLLPLTALLALVFAGTADAATGQLTAAKAKTYTVTRTVGPYNGAAKWYEPGAVPDGEAVVVNCTPGDTAVSGTATINKKTSHGKSAKVLRIGRTGVGLSEEGGYSQYYAFVLATGKKGWNSVTLTATCRRS